jgi:glucose-6-phosphate isomerase
MELPDEAIGYNYQGLVAPAIEEWTAQAELRAKHFVSPSRFKELHQRLMQCRSQVAADRELRNAGPEMLPLEPGFINLPQELLDGYRRKQDSSDLGRCLNLANRLREEADRIVFLGVGGSYLGAKALFGALRSAHHNELPPETRLGVPRIYFDGNSADNDSLQDLLELLQISCVDPDRREERWGVVSISRSAVALEPAIALRVFRREATEYYGLRSPWLTRLFASVTGSNTKLRDLYKSLGIPEDGILSIPDNVSSRFSVFSSAGLLPAAVMGLDVRALLLGAAMMTKRFLEEPVERNPVLQYAGLNYLLHTEQHKSLRVMSVWSRKLEGIGTWYEQLLSESLGKRGGGPTPLTMVGTRDLFIRGQQMQEGPRDRVINNLYVKQGQHLPIMIGMADQNEDELNQFNRRGIPDLSRHSLEAVSRNHLDSGRPSADIVVPSITEHTMGQLLQMLMLATIVEGRLMGVNPYGQPGAETYRRSMLQSLRSAPDGSNQGTGFRPA